jgi:DNA-binding NtrC family response regulator
MDSLPRSRLGTYPPDIADNHEEPEAPCLGLSVRLDRPFHELKEFLLAEFERAYLTRCLTESEMNVSLASRSSGLSRKHLRTLMAKYGIRRGQTLSDVDDVSDVGDVSDVSDASGEAA